jgi:hypothetical protein
MSSQAGVALFLDPSRGDFYDSDGISPVISEAYGKDAFRL